MPKKHTGFQTSTGSFTSLVSIVAGTIRVRVAGSWMMAWFDPENAQIVMFVT